MPSSTEEVRCPVCGVAFSTDVETQYEGDVRITAIKGKGETMTYGTSFPYDPQEDKMAKQSEELVKAISLLSLARARFDRFNLEVAELRVEKGMSSGFARLYQVMGSWDRRIQELITDAEIISRDYPPS